MGWRWIGDVGRKKAGPATSRATEKEVGGEAVWYGYFLPFPLAAGHI